MLVFYSVTGCRLHAIVTHLHTFENTKTSPCVCVMLQYSHVCFHAHTHIHTYTHTHTQSLHSSRKCKGLKILWGPDERPGFMARWNPMSSSIPYTILTSHILFRRGKVNNLRLDIEDAKVKIEEAIRDYQRASKVHM